jgi:hypothetical protein
LIEHGINPPEATAFIDQLKDHEIYRGPLPVHLEDAIQLTKELITESGS